MPPFCGLVWYFKPQRAAVKSNFRRPGPAGRTAGRRRSGRRSPGGVHVAVDLPAAAQLAFRRPADESLHIGGGVIEKQADLVGKTALRCKAALQVPQEHAEAVGLRVGEPRQQGADLRTGQSAAEHGRAIGQHQGAAAGAAENEKAQPRAVKRPVILAQVPFQGGKFRLRQGKQAGGLFAQQRGRAVLRQTALQNGVLHGMLLSVVRYN